MFSELEDIVDEKVHPLDWAKVHLEPQFPGIKFNSAGGAVPFQAEGIYMGALDFYFRFRHDYASLTMGRPGRNVPEPDLVVAKADIFGEPFAGFLTNEQFGDIFSELMNDLFVLYGLPRP